MAPSDIDRSGERTLSMLIQDGARFGGAIALRISQIPRCTNGLGMRKHPNDHSYCSCDNQNQSEDYIQQIRHRNVFRITFHVPFSLLVGLNSRASDSRTPLKRILGNRDSHFPVMGEIPSMRRPSPTNQRPSQSDANNGSKPQCRPICRSQPRDICGTRRLAVPDVDSPNPAGDTDETQKEADPLFHNDNAWVCDGVLFVRLYTLIFPCGDSPMFASG